MKAREGALTLTATDNETSSRIVEPAEVRVYGRALLPGKKLFDIVKSLPSGMVELVVDGVWGTLTAGKSRFKLVGLDTTEFPNLPEPDMSADV